MLAQTRCGCIDGAPTMGIRTEKSNFAGGGAAVANTYFSVKMTFLAYIL